ncbi:hypothetical protein ACWD48_26840 [Streptomyces sp. NPDC002519]
MSGPEAVVLIVIIIVAAALVAVGLPAASVALLLTEAGALGVLLIRQLRGTVDDEPAPTEA